MYTKIRRRLLKLWFLINAAKEFLKLSFIDPQKEIILSYDEKHNPLTYGDFLYYPFLANLLQLKGLRVRFNYIKDFSIKGSHIMNFRSQIEEIFERISPNTEISFLPLKELKSKDKSYFVYRKEIFSGRKINNFLFDLINLLFLKERNTSFLIEKRNDFDMKKSIRQESYITLHVRYNKLYGANRNITKGDFNQILEALTYKYNKPILIVTDLEGTNFCKRIPINKDIKIFFSKDYFDRFVDDIEVILQSDMYFQYLGGGIGVIPMFSSIPYRICDTSGNEFKFNKNALCSWASEKQLRVSSTKLQSFLDII